jgi:predicted RNase H-like HicB family nuclease
MRTAIKKGSSPKRSSGLKEKLSKHPMVIEWSEDDQVYLAKFPSLKGCVTHGKTPEAAFKNGLDAIETYFS